MQSLPGQEEPGLARGGTLRLKQEGVWDVLQQLGSLYIHNILLAVISDTEALTSRFSGEESSNEDILNTERSNLMCPWHTSRLVLFCLFVFVFVFVWSCLLIFLYALVTFGFGILVWIWFDLFRVAVLLLFFHF